MGTKRVGKNVLVNKNPRLVKLNSEMERRRQQAGEIKKFYLNLFLVLVFLNIFFVLIYEIDSVILIYLNLIAILPGFYLVMLTKRTLSKRGRK